MIKHVWAAKLDNSRGIIYNERRNVTYGGFEWFLRITIKY